MKKHILILGGYGGIGKALACNILKNIDPEIAIAISGRSISKAKNFVNVLGKEYPNSNITASYADATEKRSLTKALKDIDIIIVTTTPDSIGIIAEAAIATNTDMIDILVREDVVDALEKHRKHIISHNRVFITQAGFHTGLPAPFIRYAKDLFDDYQTANVVMVMNSLFEKSESTHEIIHEIGRNNAVTLKNGLWKKASYKDCISVQFSDKFGIQKCYPIHMREIHPLEKELAISNMGVYSAGFNTFVNHVVFPLTMLLYKIKKGLGKKLCGKLMYWGIHKYAGNKPGVEFKLIANGLKNGMQKNYVLEAHSSNAFELTALAVIACLRQYLNSSAIEPNLYLMGNFVDEKRIVDDLKQMGIKFHEKLW